MKKKIITTLFTFSALLLSSCTLPGLPSTSNDNSSENSNSNVDTSGSNNTNTSTGEGSISHENTTSNDIPTTTTEETTTSDNTATTSDTALIPAEDPYKRIDTLAEIKEFYTTYSRATSYEDAQYRTQHKLISGDNEPSDYKIVLNTNNTNTTATVYRNNVTEYTYRDDNSYESYRMYSLDGTFETIYYGGAYSSINEVAAYLFAFGDVPPNIISNNKGYEDAAEWYLYGRVNNNAYSGPQPPGKKINSYKYEPCLYGQIRKQENLLNYYEADFGDSVYFNETVYDPQYEPMTYYEDGRGGNSGFQRGVLRFCYTAKKANEKVFDDLNNRRVYFTYNHYNDFIEYLNYKDGFGKVFGNMTEGGKYNDNSVEYAKDDELPLPVDVSYTQIKF